MLLSYLDIKYGLIDSSIDKSAPIHLQHLFINDDDDDSFVFAMNDFNDFIDKTTDNDSGSVVTMDEFLSAAVSKYPDLAEVNFRMAIDIVVTRTGSEELYDNYMESQGNLLEFLGELIDKLTLT